MEVGCGWGLLGIYCDKKWGADVVGVDADSKVFPYLHLHAEVNEVTIQTRTARFENMRKSHLEGTHLMVGGDICFWDEMIDPLSKLVNRAMKAGIDQVIVADPGRPPFDDVCERAQKKWGAELKEWEVTKPSKARGWLLIVGGQA